MSSAMDTTELLGGFEQVSFPQFHKGVSSTMDTLHNSVGSAVDNLHNSVFLGIPYTAVWVVL